MNPRNAMPAPTPSISIILVCKNPGDHLEVALASIWAQTAVAVELIVIDGGSSDGTREWLVARRAQFAVLVSEPDRGVYDAMNKGLARATGEWVLFLGADDRLVGDTILSAALNWMRTTESGVCAGEVAYDDGRIYKLRSRVNPLARNFVHHQGVFYRRSVFTEGGAFDPAFTIMGDYELNLRLWKDRVRFKPLPLRIAACGVHGLSDSGSWLGYREEIIVRHRYAPAWKCWWWDGLSCARFARKKILRTLMGGKPRPKRKRREPTF